MKLQVAVTSASLGMLACAVALLALNAPLAVAAPLVATAPQPAVASCVNYCTAGVSTNGCVATMSCSGVPSAGALSGYVLTTSGLEGQKNALMRFSVTGRNATVWAAGSSSFLCIKAPHVKLGGVQNSGGTFGACDGVIQVDFLAWAASHAWPLLVGSDYYVQTFYKDPPAPKSINLSDGLEFTIVP